MKRFALGCVVVVVFVLGVWFGRGSHSATVCQEDEVWSWVDQNRRSCVNYDDVEARLP